MKKIDYRSLTYEDIKKMEDEGKLIPIPDYEDKEGWKQHFIIINNEYAEYEAYLANQANPEKVK